MAGQEGLEPPTVGFGDRCSSQLNYWPATIVVAVATCPVPPKTLFGLAMQSVLAAETAILFKLQLVRSILLVLCCRVVALLALGAGKSHDIAH